MYSMFEVTSALKSIPPLAGYDVAEFFMGKVQSKHNLALVKGTLHFVLSFVRFLVFAYFNMIVHNNVLSRMDLIAHVYLD